MHSDAVFKYLGVLNTETRGQYIEVPGLGSKLDD